MSFLQVQLLLAALDYDKIFTKILLKIPNVGSVGLEVREGEPVIMWLLDRIPTPCRTTWVRQVDMAD